MRAPRDLQHPARAVAGRRPVDVDRFADAVRAAGRRRPGAAGGRPRPAPLGRRRPHRGRRRGDGRGRAPVRRGAVRHARGPRGWRPPARSSPDAAAYGIALLSPLPGAVLAGGPAAARCRTRSRCASRAGGRPMLVRDEPRVAVARGARRPRRASSPWPTPTCRSSLVERRSAAPAGARPAHATGPLVLMGDLNMGRAPRPRGHRHAPAGAARPPSPSHAAGAAARPRPRRGARPGRVAGRGARRLPLSDHRALSVDL